MTPRSTLNAPDLDKPQLLQRDVRSMILPGLWLLFITLTAFGTVSNAVSYLRAAGSPYADLGAELFTGPLALDLWALLAARLFGLVVRNRRRWSNGRRFAVGGILLTTMLGRLAGGGLFGIGLNFLAVPAWVAVIAAPFSQTNTGCER